MWKKHLVPLPHSYAVGSSEGKEAGVRLPEKVENDLREAKGHLALYLGKRALPPSLHLEKKTKKKSTNTKLSLCPTLKEKQSRN